MNINIDTFNKWAKTNRDKSMEIGHYPSVNKMFSLITDNTSIFQSNFTFIDIGCGNGWVVRKALENSRCIYALGIDGSKNMIKKALEEEKGDFIQTEIEKFNFKNKFEIVFSMETFYYFQNPKNILQNIYKNGLKKNGIIIIGVDHFKENTESLSWGKDYNLDLTTLSINDWISTLKETNYKKINFLIHEYNNNNKTLIIYATK